MNKITKIGLSALCGSLASVSAVNAGTLDVTGSATATYVTRGGEVTGNPIGMASSMTFTGNGELDGGQTFKVAIAHTNKAAFSVAGITLNTNSLGKFVLSSAEGGRGIGGYDDNMPTAWEEVWGTGISTSVNLEKGVGSSTNISWTSPTFAATTLQIAYAPDNDGVANNNKATSGSASDHFSRGYDAVLDINPTWDSGSINLFVGGSVTEVAREKGVLKDLTGDHEEAVVGLKLSLGPLEAGGQISGTHLQTQSYNAVQYYGNTSWGVAFNINDNLSISYSEVQHLQARTKKQGSGVEASGVTGASTSTVAPAVRGIYDVKEDYHPKSWMRGDSLQVAYTIGGIGLKFAETSYDNTGYSYDKKEPRDAKTLAVSLAF